MDSPGKKLVIPVFIPHSGCPHQCAFCNQAILTEYAFKIPDKAQVHETIHTYLKYKKNRKTVEVAFFGGNFLGLPKAFVRQLMDWVMPFYNQKKVDGIRFSTRPDTINDEMLDLIGSYPVTLVELGVQSMTDEVLTASRRGHTRNDTIRAFEKLKQRGYRTGAQLMLGLPKETENSLMASTRVVAALEPDVARVYPLLVLKGSLLETWYQNGKYSPLGLEDSIRMAKQMVIILRDAGIKVIRLGLQASDLMNDETMVLAGPWHPAFGHLVFSRIMYEKVCKQVEMLVDKRPGATVNLRVHPKSESRLRGNKNQNLEKLKIRFTGKAFQICTDETLGLDDVGIEVLGS